GDVALWLSLEAFPGEVTAVVPNRGVRAALEDYRWGSGALASGRLTLRGGSARAVLQLSSGWDLIYLPLRGGYRPVGWGATSLAEDYGVTVEAVQDALAAL